MVVVSLASQGGTTCGGITPRNGTFYEDRAFLHDNVRTVGSEFVILSTVSYARGPKSDRAEVKYDHGGRKGKSSLANSESSHS